jgi:hypothetical protein
MVILTEENLYEASLRETVAVGLAEGVRLPPDIAEKTLAMMRSMPPHHTTSMGNDLLRGNRLELPWFAGKVIELGRRRSIPTPMNGFIYAALKPYTNGAPPRVWPAISCARQRWLKMDSRLFRSAIWPFEDDLKSS